MEYLIAAIFFAAGWGVGRRRTAPNLLTEIVKEQLTTLRLEEMVEERLATIEPRVEIDTQAVFHASAALDLIETHVEETGIPLSVEHQAIVDEMRPFYTIETTH
jgi:hypothetical protein